MTFTILHFRMLSSKIVTVFFMTCEKHVYYLRQFQYSYLKRLNHTADAAVEKKVNIMKTDKISAEVRNILIENKMYDLWLEHTSEGLIICKKKNYSIIYINRQCLDMFSLDADEIPGTLTELFNEHEMEDISRQKNSICLSYRGSLEVNSILANNYILIIINDLTKVANIEKKANEIKQLNKELQTVFEQYADDTIFITDGKGTVEFSGTVIAANCGVTPGYMIGKNVCELEKEKYFYPSVTAMVLDHKQSEVTIQNTKTGKTLVAVGTPIFDEKGNISKVISITRDYSRQIKIGTLLSTVREEKQEEPDFDNAHENIVTCNDKMLNIIALAKLVAMVNSTVLINGETGTGKEVIARYISGMGPRASKPFIKVNCGAISPNLVESELFGYESGSFTGAKKEGKTGLVEAANGGTLFLDEISELPLNQQVKLLQVIQERSMTRVGGTKDIKLDIRIIAATNKDLEEQVRKGEFREDLFYRLNVVPINLPPLRERAEDIPLLIRHFLNSFKLETDINKEFTKEAFSIMCHYSWPGNVRELLNTVERLTITTPGTLIDADDLPDKIRGNEDENSDPIQIRRIMKLDEAVADVERKLIKMAVDKYGSGKKAAELLGVNQSTISRKMSQYGITTNK